MFPSSQAPLQSTPNSLPNRNGRCSIAPARLITPSLSALTLDRGTLTLAYDWWEPGKFSIQTNIAHGNAWAFFPADIAYHLVAETGHGKIESDFVESTERETKEITKIDTLFEGGGEAAVTMRMKEGNIKIVEANP